MTSDSDKDPNDNDPSEENGGAQVRVSFVLDQSIKDRSLEVPTEAIAVPASVGRKELSAVINHLLNVEDEARPFDFLMGNKLLRTGVEAAARRHGLSLEQAVMLVYFPAETAPTRQGQSEPEPDWISALDYCKSKNRGEGLLVSGSYSGTTTMFRIGTVDNNEENEKQGLETAATVAAHSGPIKCLSTASDGSGIMIATGSLDHGLKTHVWDPSSSSIKIHAEYRHGHNNSVNCVDLQGQGNLLASGDWDGGLCLWDYKNIEDFDTFHNEPSKKLTKTSNKEMEYGKKMPATGVPLVAPKVVLQAHASNISGLSWGKATFTDKTLVTSSWDHSIKVWDMEQQDCLLALNGSRVVSCMDMSQHSQVVASGHPDCTVRLWDVRVGNTQTGSVGGEANITTDTTLKPFHKAWVSSVKWSPTNPYVLASTSHDGTIKIWDIRSSLPLFSVRAHGKEEKGLCLAYGDHGVMYAGGTDCVVKQYSSAPKK